MFSPVKKVSFSIENTRAGSALDYDKLVMNVETNGTVAAEDAIAYSARILFGNKIGGKLTLIKN